MKPSKYEIGSFVFDAQLERLLKDEVGVRLPGKKKDILDALIEEYPKYISQSDLRTKVWKTETVSDHAISVHVSQLNKLLGEEIEAVRDKGYRLKSLVPKHEHDYSFCDVWAGAGEVGNHVFGSFKANAILTFAGHSAIFANLVLARCLARKDLLEIPVYLALQRDWPSSYSKKKLPTVPHYTSVAGEGVVILVPNALTESRKEIHKPLRLAVIDDVIVSAAVMVALRPYLRKHLGPLAHIEFVSFICFGQISKVMKDRKPEFTHKESTTEDFTLPWGRPLWFGQQ